MDKNTLITYRWNGHGEQFTEPLGELLAWMRADDGCINRLGDLEKTMEEEGRFPATPSCDCDPLECVCEEPALITWDDERDIPNMIAEDLQVLTDDPHVRIGQ